MPKRRLMKVLELYEDKQHSAQIEKRCAFHSQSTQVQWYAWSKSTYYEGDFRKGKFPSVCHLTDMMLGFLTNLKFLQM